MEFISWLMVIIIVILFALRIKNYIRSICLAFTLRGPPALPFLGNVLLINKEKQLEEMATNAYQMFGPLARFWISIMPFIIIYEPKHLKIILGSKTSKKNIFYRVLHNFIGKGLITNNGLKWKTHRKLIQPYFHISVLENYVSIFSEKAAELSDNLKGKIDVKITTFINKCILSILHEAVLGVPLDTEDEESPYRKGEVLLTQRVARPWLLLESIFKHTPFAEKELKQKLSLHNYTKNILLKRRQENNKPSSRCLLDIFLEISENNSEFTDEDIINEAVTFMLAGQDSVGAAIAFTLFFIAKHSDIQEKVLQELDYIYEDNGKPTLSLLNNMKYLEQCIKESLRLAPTIPMISRVLTEDVLLDEYTLPAGTNIFISPFVTHRLPHLYPDPLKFDPERFSQERAEKLHPFAFIPFSAGPRNCIGYKFGLLEIKAIVSQILHRYSISLPPEHENLNFSYRATLRAKGGIWLRLNSRR